MFLEPETSDRAVGIICKKGVGWEFGLCFSKLEEGSEGRMGVSRLKM